MNVQIIRPRIFSPSELMSFSVGAQCGFGGGGRPTYGTPESGEPCTIKPRLCECHVVGGNTLGTNGIGTASVAGRYGTVSLDSGDASYFIPHYIYVAAYQANDADTIANAAELPVLLGDSRSGQEPNMRRASDSDPRLGVITTAYSEQKELECVDWNSFTSTTNQELELTFYNPNANSVHVFVCLWGLPAD